jgi:hypothetical protein
MSGHRPAASKPRPFGTTKTGHPNGRGLLFPALRASHRAVATEAGEAGEAVKRVSEATRTRLNRSTRPCA